MDGAELAADIRAYAYGRMGYAGVLPGQKLGGDLQWTEQEC
jgi:hypothetical protein